MEVKTKIYSPQSYLEMVTKKCFIIEGNNVDRIKHILNIEGYEYKAYPISDLQTVVENNIDVTLVLCSEWDKELRSYIDAPYWFPTFPKKKTKMWVVHSNYTCDGDKYNDVYLYSNYAAAKKSFDYLVKIDQEDNFDGVFKINSNYEYEIEDNYWQIYNKNDKDAEYSEVYITEHFVED